MLAEQPLVPHSEPVWKHEAPWTPQQAAFRMYPRSNLINEEGFKLH